MSRFTATDPMESLRWEVERVREPEESTPSASALVMLACGLALLAGVMFGLIDQFRAW